MNLHFHTIFLDGCYARDRLGTPRFRPVTPHTSDVEKLVVEIAIACEAWLSKAGCGPVWRTRRRCVDPGLEDRTTMASACSRRPG